MDKIDYIVNKIHKERRGRTLVLWGENDRNLRVKLLEKLKVEEGFYVTVELKTIGKRENDKEIVHISQIDGRVSEYYIVAFPKQTAESDTMFSKYGFEKNDVAYINHGTVTLMQGEYKDEFDNFVSILPKNVKVILDGCNNHVLLGKVMVNKSLTIYCSGNSRLNIDDAVVFSEEFRISCFDKAGSEGLLSKIHISDLCHFTSGRISAFSGYIDISEKNSFNGNLQVACFSGMEIEIGKDGMFSHDILFLSGDGHVIFDCATKEPINSYKKLGKGKRKIQIGEHVWGGWRTVFLHGAKVGNGTVIGANSVIKKTFPNNVIVAGSPAKVIRKDVAWSRHPINENIGLCGEEYINYTEEAWDYEQKV